ncbi:MAG: hypothetical protein P8186_04895 [Anaerolineae bacterium]|jgi:hypothetical protein
MNFLNEHQLKLHVTILGWLYIVGNAIFLLIGAFIFMLLAGIGVASGDSQAMAILSIVGTVVGVLLAVLAIPGLVAGYGLLARKAWGRVLAIVVGILGLINFPVGTAIGIYAILVLLQEGATDYFMSHTSVQEAES